MVLIIIWVFVVGLVCSWFISWCSVCMWVDKVMNLLFMWERWLLCRCILGFLKMVELCMVFRLMMLFMKWVLVVLSCLWLVVLFKVVLIMLMKVVKWLWMMCISLGVLVCGNINVLIRFM